MDREKAVNHLNHHDNNSITGNQQTPSGYAKIDDPDEIVVLEENGESEV